MPPSGTPSPEQLYILIARAQREGLDSSVIDRLNVILHFAEQRHSISETCRQFGISRSTFHRWMDRFDPEDLSSLADKSHEPQTLRTSAIAPESIELIRRYRMRYPQMGKERIAELLRLDHGVDISPSSTGRVIERECLYFADTPFHWKKRLEKQSTTVRSGAEIIAEYESAVSTEKSPEPEPVKTLEHIHIDAEDDSSADVKTPIMRIGALGWHSLRRIIIVSSVVTNVAFVSLLLGSALFERSAEPASFDVQGETLHAAPSHLYIP